MSKKLTNISGGQVTLSDNRQDGVYRDDLVLAPGASKTISDEQFANITINAAQVSVVAIVGELSSTADLVVALGLPIAATDSAVAASADATDLATALTLVNELKANYNAAVALINEMKTKLNAL